MDTRGHAVTRTGYLLAEPKEVSPSRSGMRTKAWRLFIGPDGMDPAECSCSDDGTVEHSAKPDCTQWFHTELRQVPGIRARNHNARITFGGKGGVRSTEPTQKPVVVTVFYTDDGIYDLWERETGTVHLSCRRTTNIWWAPAPKPAKTSSA
ncbi:hypothetical protein [Streptomyces qinglanensis]|uniref:hypothetical protein n=1 Tax=Streptomyces qinglanensis TaxID=943816 RepID=UPI003D704CF4